MPDSAVARQLQSLERHKQDGDWDSYLALATSPQFQEDLAAWTVRRGTAGAAARWTSWSSRSARRSGWGGLATPRRSL